MSTPVTFNGVAYSVPAYNDTGYAQGPGNLSSYLIALASGTLQQSGGTFSLTSDVNFGLNFGLIAKYFTSTTANPATAGTIRLAHADTIDWRNNANSANLALGVNGSDQLTYNGVVINTGSGFVSSITGTVNQIIASSPTGAVILSTPQDIDAAANVTFGSVTAGTGSYLSIALGQGTIDGFIDFTNATNANIVHLRSGLTNANYTLTLPTDQGAANTFLKNNGSGALSFAAASGNFVSSITGTANQVIASAATGAVTLSLPQDIATTSSPSFHGIHLIGTPVLTIDGTSIIAINPGIGNFVDMVRATRFDDILFPNVDATVAIGQSATAFSTLYLHGTGIVLRETAAGTDTITLNAPAAITTSHSLFLPGTQGAASTFLQNDGSGNLSWVAPTGSGTVNSGTATHLAYYATSTNAVSDGNGATISGAYTWSGSNIWSTSGQFQSTLRVDNTLTLTQTTNQLILGTTNTTTITSVAPAASRVYSIQDAGAAANFVMSEGAATINGIKTFGSSPIVPNATTTTQAAAYGQVALLQYPTPVYSTTQTDSTSNTYTDATGLSITITPILATSHVLISATVSVRTTAALNQLPLMDLIITDSANTTIREWLGIFGTDFAVAQTEYGNVTLKAYDAPGSTSAKTYKVRVRRNTNSSGGTVTVNNSGIGQTSMIEATEYR